MAKWNGIRSITSIAIGFAASDCPQIADAQRPSEVRAIAEGTRAPKVDAGCALPSEPWSIPAALDGPADKDPACMKALMIPDARITLVSVGTDGATRCQLLTLDDWIARTKARGHAALEEKQLNFASIASATSRTCGVCTRCAATAIQSRAINSIQAIKEAGGWRVAEIMVQGESAAAPLPEEYLP